MTRIEKSKFRNEYVGYAKGVWRIWKYFSNKDWIAVCGAKTLRTKTLKEMNNKLEIIAREMSA